MKSFPKVEHDCYTCGGSGREDVSYHGSPIYEDCSYCKGKCNVKYFREQTTDEKLTFLLELINEVVMK